MTIARLAVACLLPILLEPTLSAGEIRLDRVGAGPDLDLPERFHPARYRALYDDAEDNPDVLVLRCVHGAGPMADTCLAARLLHRVDLPVRSVAWLRERAVILAVLRELAARRPRGALAVYARLLERERRHKVIRAALLGAFRQDPQRAADLAYELAVPGADRPAAAADPTVRRLALRMMHDCIGKPTARFRQAVVVAVLRGGPVEAADAVTLAPDQDAGRVAARALERFLPALDRPAERDLVWPVVVRALARFEEEADPGLAAGLLARVPQGTTPLYCAVANAVAAGRLVTPPPAPVLDAVVERARSMPPGAGRRALVALLVRWRPAVLPELLPAGDPRRRLAGERARRAADRPPSFD